MNIVRRLNPTVKLFGKRYIVENRYEKTKNFCVNSLPHIPENVVFKEFLTFSIGEAGAKEVMLHALTLAEQEAVLLKILPIALCISNAYVKNIIMEEEKAKKNE